MPAAMGGSGSGPNRGWLLRAGLASCNATVIAMRAAQLGVKLNTLEVTVESDSDNRAMLGLDERISAGLLSLRTKVKIGAESVTPAQTARNRHVGRRPFASRLYHPPSARCDD